MAACVQVDGSGFVKVMDPQPANGGECDLLIVSGAEWGNDIFHVSVQGGVDVSVAILLVWATAWTFKQVIHALSIGDTKEGNHDE